MAESKIKFLTYKGKPLVRKDNIVYYGNMSDPYVVMLTIKTTKTLGDVELADRVSVQLLNTDPDCPIKQKVLKQKEKKGFYNAMDIGSIWLQRALDKGAI